MLNLNSFMIGSQQPEKLAEFYSGVLDKKPDWTDEDWYGWTVGNCHLTIGPHSEIKGRAREPQRLILNLETTDVLHESERLKKLGTPVIKEPYQIDDMWIATFADADGNYFQLMSSWKGDK